MPLIKKQPLNEFKSMVKALHQAGIEVILDVVFNHTAESEKHSQHFVSAVLMTNLLLAKRAW